MQKILAIPHCPQQVCSSLKVLYLQHVAHFSPIWWNIHTDKHSHDKTWFLLQHTYCCFFGMELNELREVIYEKSSSRNDMAGEVVFPSEIKEGIIVKEIRSTRKSRLLFQLKMNVFNFKFLEEGKPLIIILQMILCCMLSWNYN